MRSVGTRISMDLVGLISLIASDFGGGQGFLLAKTKADLGWFLRGDNKLIVSGNPGWVW